MKRIVFVLILVGIFLNLSSQNRRTTTPSTKESPSKTTTAVSDKREDKKILEKELGVSTETSTASKNNYAKTFLNPSSEATKMSTTIEFGGYPSDADITTINVYGHLGLNFDIGRMFHIGPYFKHKILSTHEYQEITYENISYDVSSFKEWGTGLSLGAYFPLGRTMLIHPELRMGYNEFTIQSPSFSDTANNFLHRTYINFTPRINLGFRLSEYTIFNLSGGYILPYYLNNPESVPQYNPSTFMYGLGLRFYLVK